jgi:RHS repeat-associated protein
METGRQAVTTRDGKQVTFRGDGSRHLSDNADGAWAAARGWARSPIAITYAYDLADQLVSATVGTTTETYTWTGDGIRRSAATGAQAMKTTQFVVDRTLGAGSVVAERTGSGTLVRRYVYGLDLLAQTTSNKGPYWYHHDGLGSVTDITSSTGSPLAWTEYTPFGTIRAAGATSQAPVNLLRFTGEYRDGSTALYHLRARQYDPTTGRFLSTDPVSPAIGDPAIGAYVYVGNNPVRYTDPSGRNPLCGGILAFAEFGPVDWAAALACLAVTGALFVEAANVVRLASDLVRWPLTPSGTLQEPPLVNVGPQPPPQPNRPPFRCTTKGQKIVCVTLAGLTFVYYNTANRDSAPTPQPGPPPDVPPVIPRGSRK